MNTNYLGKGDIFDYGKGQMTFAGEIATGNKYGLKFVNSGSATKVVGIAPAVLLGLAPAVVDAKVSGIDTYLDGDGDLLTGLDETGGGTSGKVTATTLESENPTDLLLHLANFHPARIVRMQLNSDQKGQFSQTISQRVITPYKKNDVAELDLSLRDYVDANQFQSDRTEVPLLRDNNVLMFAPDTIIMIPVVGDSTLEINFSIGAQNNPSHTLRKRAAAAHRNIVLKRGGSIQRK